MIHVYCLRRGGTLLTRDMVSWKSGNPGELWVTTNKAFAERWARTMTLDPLFPIRVHDIVCVNPFDHPQE